MSEDKELPRGWEASSLGEACEISAGVGFPNGLQGKASGEYPFFKVGDISEAWQDGRKALVQAKHYVSQDDLVALKARPLREGSVVFAKIGAAISLNRRAVLGQPSLIDNNCMALWVPSAHLLPDYLFYFTCTLRLGELARASVVPSLRKSDLEVLPFPIPPLPEQHRIVEKIDEVFSDLDAGVASLQRAKGNLKRYRASVLKSAVEGRLTEEWRKGNPQAEDALGQIERTPAPPLPNRWSTRSKDIIPGHGALAVGNPDTPLPESWTWTPLVRVARMETGHTPSRKHPDWWGGEVPWISISDARKHHGGLILETEEMTNADGLANSASRLLPKGTVCISRTASVGYVIVMGCDMATSQDFVNWVPSDCVLSDWLRIVFMADRNVLLRFGKGSVHKTIYFPEWLSTHIALPPLAEQEQIVALVEERLSQIDSAEKTIDAELIRAKRLRQSILKTAFEGKLVPQNPKDEPASVLLERIKATREAEQPKKKAKKVKSK
jgi:type I restriction enzyme S subunit